MWRHRHMGQPVAIVTSQWSIVPTGNYGLMMLRSTRVKGIASTRRERWLGSGGWIHKLHIFVYFHFHFQTPVFQHGASLVIIITIIVIIIIIIILIIIIAFVFSNKWCISAWVKLYYLQFSQELYVVHTLLCFVVDYCDKFYPYPSGLCHRHWDNHMIPSASESTLNDMGKLTMWVTLMVLWDVFWVPHS